MTIKSAELFISIVTVLLAYFVCAPVIGYIRAWVAEEMGDNTPEQLGFLTVNPFVHVSRVWLVLIIWLQVLFQYMPFGLGRYIPINPLNIQGNARGFRLAAAYFSDTVAAIGIAVVAFFLTIAMHGAQALRLLQQVVTLHNLAMVNPSATTLGIVLTWMLMTFFIMSSLMAAFSLIINCFHFVFFYFFEDTLRENEHADMIMLFGPLVLLYILITTVRASIMKFVVGVAYLLAYMVGVVS